MLVFTKFKSLYSRFAGRQNIQDANKIETPPQRFIDLVGGGDFKAVGDEFLNHFIQLAQLSPDHRVLDIGCGTGRMAIPLTSFLSKKGSYEGFDIVREMVTWCQKNITPKFPKFRFKVADVFNSLYEKNGINKGEKFHFPFHDKEFDFIFLTSVFTHMLPDEMENYLAEISRTIRPGGKCLITYFILNESSLKCILDQKSTFQFKHQYQGCFIDQVDVPEAAVGYEEEKIKSLFAKYSFILDSIHYGNWCGRKEYVSFQDIIILKKKDS